MDIKLRENEYQVRLNAGEFIQIEINGQEAFTDTVRDNCIANVYFKFSEKGGE